MAHYISDGRMEIKEKNDKITSNWKNVNNWYVYLGTFCSRECIPHVTDSLTSFTLITISKKALG